MSTSQDNRSNQTDPNSSADSRRSFLKKTSAIAAVAAVPLSFPRGVHAGTVENETLRIGIVGTGGRGTSAAFNALNSNSDVKVVALADVAQNRLDTSRKTLMNKWGEQGKADIPDANCFVGKDAFKQVCAHPDVDIVIHTTPPGLRPLTLRVAVENNKHSFVEKPVCVDPSAYHHVIESGEMAKSKGLAIVSGTQYRRETSYQDAMKHLHDGVIGDITSAFAYYCTGALWLRGDKTDWEKWGGFDGMEYQMRNWLYFTWLSGDHIAEQAIHNMDAINWAMNSAPISAYGNGGRIARTDPKFGNVYDHFAVDYDYPGDVRVSFKCQQIPGADGRVTNRFYGTKGVMDIRPNPGRTASVARDLDGKVIWNNNGRDNNAPYEQEHIDLIASIRDGKPIMEIQEVADVSLTTVIGREAAYSGKEVKFDWAAKESKLGLLPKDITADTNPVAPMRIPGVYKLS